MFSTTQGITVLIKIINKIMRKTSLGLTTIIMFCFVGNAQDNNTALALRRMLMVTSVELLQRSTPKETTKEDFNKQLAKNEVSKEGVLFLNKAFEFYKKEISTEKILSSYDGEESGEVIKYINNGGKDTFGDLNNPIILEKKDLWKWLRDILKGMLDVTKIAITICDIMPWPC